MAPIVLLHAFGSSRRAWQPQLDALGAGRKVSAPDLPGHGDEPGPFSLDRAVAKALPTDEPAHLVAISGSVSVALLAAIANPDRVASLTLSGGAARGYRADAVQRGLMRLMPEKMIVGILRTMYAGGQDKWLAQATEDLRRAGKHTILTGLAELARLDLRADLAALEVPTLILNGAEDKANVPRAQELAATIPDAELRIVPDAGHIWNLQHPDLFTETIRTFTEKATR